MLSVHHLLFLGMVAAPTLSRDDANLEGVWESHSVKGPKLKGTLCLSKSKDGIVAEIDGNTAQCSIKGSNIQAKFANGLGELKATILSSGEHPEGAHPLRA